MKPIKKTIVIFTVLVSILIVSCSSKNSGVPLSEQRLPSMILYDASYTFRSEGRQPITMKAVEISVYKDPDETELRTVEFSQTKNGTEDLYGSCDYAKSEDNENIILSGNVKLYKKSDDISIECDILTWNDEMQIIKSDKKVHIIYNDGTDVTGYGFVGYLQDDYYEFSSIEEGIFNAD